MKKVSKAEVDQTSASTSKAEPSKQNYQTQTTNQTLGLPITRIVNNLWKWTFVVPLFHHGLAKVPSPNMAPNHRIIIPITRNNLKGCVLLEAKHSDPVFHREVDMSDLASQYAEEVETFRHILDFPDPRATMPRSSTTVLGMDDEKGQQLLRPRGPSAMLPLSPYLKDAFE